MDQPLTSYTLFLLAPLVICQTSMRNIPPNFLIGASTSAYQFEGAWNEDGKGPSVWDVALHSNSSLVQDGTNGDIASDLYHHYKTDIQLMKNLGLQTLRVSISWPRILPTGFANKTNQAGIDHYHSFFDELIRNDITPFVTMTHFDLPANLQELGGWTNPDIVQWFVDYAKVLFDNFGDKVKFWVTIHEPFILCYGGYGVGFAAPFLKLQGTADYQCTKNFLLAHAETYHLYRKSYWPTQRGEVGISLNSFWYQPMTDSVEDQIAAADAFDFYVGYYANPILSKNGDFPDVIKQILAESNGDQGFDSSRLTTLTQQQVDFIKGTADFVCISMYSSVVVHKNPSDTKRYSLPSSIRNAGKIIRDPCGLYKLLVEIKRVYNNPTVYITENGLSSAGGLDDEDRIRYVAGFMNAVLDAVDDKCDVRGYSIWSFMDNFEWETGFKEKCGLYEVDFSSPDLTRTPRKSAFFYKNVTHTRKIQTYPKCKLDKKQLTHQN